MDSSVVLSSEQRPKQLRNVAAHASYQALAKYDGVFSLETNQSRKFLALLIDICKAAFADERARGRDRLRSASSIFQIQKESRLG